MSYPVKCPICEGHGIVHGGFYTHTPDAEQWTSNKTQETCRACFGRGIIWADEEATKG